jgi:hypothetical protein
VFLPCTGAAISGCTASQARAALPIEVLTGLELGGAPPERHPMHLDTMTVMATLPQLRKDLPAAHDVWHRMFAVSRSEAGVGSKGDECGRPHCCPREREFGASRKKDSKQRGTDGGREIGDV